MGFFNRVFCILILLSLMAPVVTAAPSVFSDAELNDLLTTLEANLSGLKTLNAKFEQRKHISLFDETLTADGQLLFESPGKIRFEILSPFKSILVVAGDEVGKYEQTGEDWKKLKLKNADAIVLVMKQIGDWMNGQFRTQSRLFELSAESRSGTTVLILKSKPKRFAKLIKQVEIEVSADKSRFKSITIRENGGDYTVLQFGSEQRKRTFPSGLFDVSRQVPVELPLSKKP